MAQNAQIVHCFRSMDKPAPKHVDDLLFRAVPPEIKALNKQARKELRIKQRAEWKAKNERTN